MTGIPYDQLLDERVAVLAFVMVIVLLTTLLGLGIPLLKLLARMTEASIAAQSKAETALAGATAAQTALTNAGQNILNALQANTSELRAQTAALTGLGDRVETSGKATTKAITERLDAHDAVAQNGIKNIEAGLAEAKAAIEQLRAEIAAGHKAQRTELLGKLDLVLARLAAVDQLPASGKLGLKPATETGGAGGEA